VAAANADREVERAYSKHDADLDATFFLLLVTQAVRSVKNNQLRVARNALVERYLVKVAAKPVSSGGAGSVGTVRTENAGTRVTIDFGQMRSLYRVRVPSGYQLDKIKIWQGTQFGADVAVSGQLPSEVQTEKLLLELLVVGTALNADALVDGVRLEFSDGPRDLSLSLDGTVVWRHAGPIRPSHEEAAVVGKWNTDHEILVDLTAALAALTGDPTANESLVTHELLLESGIAGALSLTLPSPGSDQRIRRIRRVADAERSFTEEGEQFVTLTLPAATSRVLDQATLRLIGAPPDHRVVPQIGPTPTDLVEFTLDADHALCMTLPASSGLTQITGVRLPLRIGAGGAEVRVVLWDPADGLPTEPRSDGVSEPLALEALPDAATVPWTTFLFPKPVPLVEAELPWVAVLVNRGSATLRPGVSPTDGASASLRRGPPDGPWLALPAPLRSGDFSKFASPARVVGLCKDDEVTLVELALGGVVTQVTPTPRGVPIRLTPASTHTTSPQLRLRSRAAVDLDLVDIELITSE
jgi:hypothetical protein